MKEIYWRVQGVEGRIQGWVLLLGVDTGNWTKGQDFYRILRGRDFQREDC